METDNCFVKPAEVHVESENRVSPEVEVRRSKDEQSDSYRSDAVKSSEESNSMVSDGDMSEIVESEDEEAIEGASVTSEENDQSRIFFIKCIL